MNDNIWISDYLSTHYVEVTPFAFYRDIFPFGSLAEEGKKEIGKYRAIAVELQQLDNGIKAKRYFINNELKELDNVIKSNQFTIIAPISYAGKERNSSNARLIYAMAIDIDGIAKESNLIDYFYQMENDIIPTPTYTVFSGTGIHAYYVLEKPIACYSTIAKQVAILKRELTKIIWNGYIVGQLDTQIQYESLFQGFRAVGSITKGGGRTKAYRIGKKVSIEYLNSFVDDKYKVKLSEYKKATMSLEEAKKQDWFEEWYKKRIIEKQPKGTWKNKEDLYYWWLKRIPNEAKYGHRYFAIMVLAIYAKKCGINRKQLEKDAFNLLEEMDKLTKDENNHFTNSDILSALEAYNDNYITFPIDSIVELTNIPITKNKRNYRKQEVHCEYMREIIKFKRKTGEMVDNKKRFKEYRKANPNKTVTEYSIELNLSRTTIYKYLKEEKNE